MGNEDTVRRTLCIMGDYTMGVGVFVWGVLLNSRNLNYSALGTAIDFLLDRLTKSRALGQ